MTYQQKLVLGFLITLAWSTGSNRMALAADPPERSASIFSGLVPDIGFRRSPTPPGGTSAAWQTRSQDRVQDGSRGDIRFNKPVIAQARSAGSAASPATPAPIVKPVPQITLQPKVIPTVIASDQDPAIPGPPSITFGQPTLAHASGAVQTTAVRADKPSLSAVSQAVASAPLERLPKPLPPPMSATPSVATIPQQNLPQVIPEPQQSSKTEARPEARLTDERLQLVSQMLIDNQVKQAAEDGMHSGSPAGPGGRAAEAPHDVPHGLELDDSRICADECCPVAPRLFWTAGVEATFLSPDLNSDGVSFAVEETDEDRYDLCTTSTDDVDSLYVAPRIWLGVQGCDWGANLRYWHLRAGEGSYDPSIGGLGTWDGYDCGAPDFGFMTSNRLEAYTIDLELTRRFCLNDCAMQATVGVRHAEINQDEGLFGLANTNEGLLTGFARANRLSRGTGLQLGLYGRKPLYPCSCAHWFYNARWSALWGPTQTWVETFASVQTTVNNVSGSAASVNGAYTNVDDTLFIGEIQLGLEWEYALRCIPANAFFRAAIEYQRWDGGIGFSTAKSFAGATIVGQTDPTAIVTTTASAAEPQMDLVGFTLGTGLTW